jgi:hypothetical protein
LISINQVGLFRRDANLHAVAYLSDTTQQSMIIS